MNETVDGPNHPDPFWGTATAGTGALDGDGWAPDPLTCHPRRTWARWQQWATQRPYRHWRRPEPGDVGVVLVSSGAYDPIHDGHLDALHAAAATVTTIGATLVAGVVVVDHDDYVAAKHDDWTSQRRRVDTVRSTLDHQRELASFDVEASEENTNYTSHLRRIRFAAVHSGVDDGTLSYWFVYGSDNWRLGRALSRGPAWAHGCMVPRTGTGTWEHVDGVIVTAGSGRPLSSSLLRQQRATR